MKDFTQGSVVKHIATMALPIAVAMLMQMLYQLVDLYFVADLGDAAIAGVSGAGNVMFIVVALTQVLSSGNVALIAQAAGRKDAADANVIFNQSLGLSVLCGVATLVVGYSCAGIYIRYVSADASTAQAGLTYLFWFMPGLACLFLLGSMGAALRGHGIARPQMLIQMATVVVNVILAPVLIAGVGTGRPLGVAGAGLASTISIAFGVVLLSIHFRRFRHKLMVDFKLWKPQLRQWKRMLDIGLPAGGEYVLMFLYTALVFYFIRDFGAAAQAGYGVGARVVNAIMIPAMSIAFAVGPVAGQNFGAKNAGRVKEVFRAGALLISGVMLVITALAQWRPELLIGVFTKEAEVLATGALFLQIISWNFVAQGLILTSSRMFQGMGNTWPPLFVSAASLAIFAVAAIWLSPQPNFRIEHIWYLSIATATLQAVASASILNREFGRRFASILLQQKIA